LGLEHLQEDSIGGQLVEHAAEELKSHRLSTAGQRWTILTLPGMGAA